MFRMGFQNPPDYQDNQGFCGGREYQIEQGGKCGICGDPWLANPKEHEAPGGKYAIWIFYYLFTLPFPANRLQSWKFYVKIIHLLFQVNMPMGSSPIHME